MKNDKAFHEYVMADVLGHIDGVTSRAMFGGWGIYKDGTIFGLIADGELYFKVNDENRQYFEDAGSHAFHYSSKDRKAVTMSYWTLPEEVMENRDDLEEWVRRSVAAGRKKS